MQTLSFIVHIYHPLVSFSHILLFEISIQPLKVIVGSDFDDGDNDADTSIDTDGSLGSVGITDAFPG